MDFLTLAQARGALSEVYCDDGNDLTVSYTVKNKTLGADITSQFNNLFSVKHVKLGKVHILEITGGKKSIIQRLLHTKRH